ncbi:MAG TPA: type II toxin-antitoxin system VapC family toxin [Pirellulaceae bacterium]|jgi:hypothetical protein
MSRYFLDSSALVKRYHQESGTEEVERLFQRTGDRLFISRLALVEIHSCFARLVREGVLAAGDFGSLVARVEADVASGLLIVAALSNPRLNEASVLLGTHGLIHPIRTLDAIHLATAQALDRRANLTAFIAADKRLLASAIACGLAILDVA